MLAHGPLPRCGALLPNRSTSTECSSTFICPLRGAKKHARRTCDTSFLSSMELTFVLELCVTRSLFLPHTCTLAGLAGNRFGHCRPGSLHSSDANHEANVQVGMKQTGAHGCNLPIQSIPVLRRLFLEKWQRFDSILNRYRNPFDSGVPKH